MTALAEPRKRLLLVLVVVALMVHSNHRVGAFQLQHHGGATAGTTTLQPVMRPIRQSTTRSLLTTSTGRSCSSSSSVVSTSTRLQAKISKSVETAEFEFQEMRAQLDSMKRAGVPSRDLGPQKRAELEGYVRQVVRKRPSPVPLEKIGAELPQSTFRLAFSTEGATLGDLPRDATVYLKFLDETTMDYVLQFSEKTFGLNSITAKSRWVINEGPTDTGLVTFVYDKIVTDAFGLMNVSVGFFGLLKGRSNFVESAYFDSTFWIERSSGPTGQEYLNVYVREE
jgi:hypothetical protein